MGSFEACIGADGGGLAAGETSRVLKLSLSTLGVMPMVCRLLFATPRLNSVLVGPRKVGALVVGWLLFLDRAEVAIVAGDG